MRRKQLQPWVGLPNILCGDFVVPELLQDAATPEALAAASLDWLQASQQPSTIALQARFTALHHPAPRHRAGCRCDPKIIAAEQAACPGTARPGGRCG
jgi:lipid-A-disaccharide synthase